MKRTKRVFAFLMAAIFALALVPRGALAVANDYTIKIQDAVVGETYTAYKIFEETRNGDAYTYRIRESNPWYQTVRNFAYDPTTGASTNKGLGLELIPGFDPTTYQVTFDKETFRQNVDDFAETLKTYLDGLTGTNLEAMRGSAAATGRLASGGTNGQATGSNKKELILEVGLTGTYDDNRGSGYYFVDTSLGSLCALGTTNTSAEVREKSKAPTLKKQVWNSSLTDQGAHQGWTTGTEDAQIGETVTFKLLVSGALGTDTDITVYDHMSDGLSLVSSSEIKVYRKVLAPRQTDISSYYDLTGKEPKSAANTTLSTEIPYCTLVDSGNYSVNAAPSSTQDSAGNDFSPSFSVTISANYAKDLGNDDILVIWYEAKLDKDAALSPAPNPNSAFLSYASQKTPTQTVGVYMHSFDLVKFAQTSNASDKTLLAGAKFKLYDANQFDSTGALVSSPTAISFVKNGTAYRVYDGTQTEATTQDIISIDTDKTSIVGLDEGIYYLIETEAPSGYNALAAPVRVTVSRSGGNTQAATDVANVSYVNGRVRTGGGFEYTSTPTSHTGAAEVDTTAITYTSGGVAIQNSTGTELPSTGGIGTTIFYVVGGALVIGSAIMLVTKRRMASGE